MTQQETQAVADGLRRWREAVPNDRLAHVVKDLLRTMQRALQYRMAQHSVTIGQWAFLRILWERDGITQRELSELAGVSEPTTYSALLSMEKRGYLTRKKLPSNMRNMSITLTPKGRALKAVLVPLAEEVNSVVIRGMSSQEISAFRMTMQRMIVNLEQDAVQSPVKPASANAPKTVKAGKAVRATRAASR